MQKYNHKEIEQKWQKFWQENKTFEVDNNFDAKNKFYALIEFPYPSGQGLHVGHPRPFTAMDVISRKKRMQGYKVLFPIGFDSFGLPTENYAIKTGRHPADITKENIENFTRQLKALGFSFDWSRQINTADPCYYKWTQWIFLQFFKKGLAYKKNMPINWCTSCKIGLANEEVVNGCCERCGGTVIKKDKEQWMLAITDYAESLLKGLEEVDYLPQIKTQQKNWIGKSQGAEIKFKIKGTDLDLEVFTTRPETIFGATYMVIAPEHSLVKELANKIENFEEVEKYIESARLKSELERTDLQKHKTGIELKGIKAINPATGEEIPVWIADYVLLTYGKGAIMSVPAHDERDFDFAKKYNLEIKCIIKPNIHKLDENVYPKQENIDKQLILQKILQGELCYTGKDNDDFLINSDFLNDLSVPEAKQKIINWLEENNIGKKKVNYKLRDWVFSRQRYWGEPIPLVYCEKCAQKKPKVLIIHGFADNSTKNWFPWLKQILEQKGFEVIVPDMPDSLSPDFDKWMQELENLGLEKNDKLFIVGHSLGGFIAQHFILKNKLKVESLILVAPAIKNLEWDILEDKYHDFADFNVIKKFLNNDVNYTELKDLANKIIVYLSDNDPFIPFEKTQKIYQDINAEVIKLKNCAHFNFSEFKEILESFPDKERLNLGWFALDESELPLELPEVEKYEPTDTGESPLSKITDWVNVKCPKCGGPARRETDTMPNWAGSSWYYLRYMDSKNDSALASWNAMSFWGPVDWYNGGMEHVVLHLLYSRFWNHFLFDIGVVPFKEPYKKRTAHGMILAKGGEKMSKSKGNVVNPDEMVERFGADALRTYIMFMGPFDQAVEWDTNGLIGVRRFLDRVWNLQDKVVLDFQDKKEVIVNLHKTIKKVSEDIDKMHFNTAVSAMMEFVNLLYKQEKFSESVYKDFIKLLSPFAPHICEEIWNRFSNEMQSLAYESWPEYKQELCEQESVKIVIQVNGKVRDNIEVKKDLSDDELKQIVLSQKKIKKYIQDKQIKKFIIVKNRLVNIVV